MSSPEVNAALAALLRSKVNVRPGTLATLPTAASRRLRSPLDLGRWLLKPLVHAPEALLLFWQRHARGHVVINPQRHGYAPGVQLVGKRQLDCVAWVSARELLVDPLLALPVAHLLDHLLGSDGLLEGPWLSDGAGRTPAWDSVGQRLRRQFELGYAPAEAGADCHAYFGWGLRSYLADRETLNVVDPGLERLLRTTVFDAGFWRSAQP